MPIGYFYNDDTIFGGTKTTYENNTQTFSIGLSLQNPLLNREKYTLYTDSSAAFGSTTLKDNKDIHSSQFNVKSDLHFTTNEGTFFADANVGAGVSFNNTYNQDVKWGTETGFYTGVKKQGDTYSLAPNYGLHIANQSSTRTDKHYTTDVDINAGLALGFRANNNNAFYGYGRVNQEITNHKNKTATLGVGMTGECNIWGADFVYNVEAGYKKNFSKTKSNNLSNIGGFGVYATVSIPLS